MFQCGFVTTSGSRKSGHQPKDITDVRLGEASGGTDRGDSD